MRPTPDRVRETLFNWLGQRFSAKAPVVIYGAGKNGVELARTLLQQGDRVPVAFLDDDPLLQRRTINGVYVYPPRSLPARPLFS